MFFELLAPLSHYFSVFNLFRYISFRTFGAVLTAFFISFLFGDRFIEWLKRKQTDGQPIRSDGPESHLITKAGTPTMGGLLILSSIAVSTLLWGHLRNWYLWIVLLTTLLFGAIGMYDDYLKLAQKNHKGLSGKKKITLQLTLSLIATCCIVWLQPSDIATGVAVPFFKNTLISLGYGFILFGMLVIVGASNAVNLTDGLDGLAIGPVMISTAVFCIITYIVGNHVFAKYLHLYYVPHSGEIAVFCGSLIGSGLGFLWFNAPPAKVFMGDTGSLSTGAALGTIALIIKHELVLAIVGGLFAIEAVSVIVQVLYYKRTKKRIFLMAPIHHHFEKKGWAEPTIVIRFWIISVLLAIIGLATLKLR